LQEVNLTGNNAHRNSCYIMKTNVPLDPPSDASSLSEQAVDAGGSHRLADLCNILVPIDFSEHSKKTIECATQLAALTGAKIKILHVLQMPEFPAAFYQGLHLAHDPMKTHVEAAKLAASSQLSLVSEQIFAKGIEAEPIVRVGKPYEEIVSAAKEMGVDLIVIGSHGHGLLLLGSTAERVVRHGACPVLVVKGTPRYK
jgi:nucleotide-binding universal stress UspA family protein